MPGPLSVRSLHSAALSAVAIALGLTSPLTTASGQSAAAVAQSARILAPVNPSNKIQLAQHLPLYADTARLPSTALPDGATFARLTLVLNRSPEVEAAFDQLLADQQNPSSSRYHRWLLPAEVGELYGPAQTDVDAVTAWLREQGLKIVDISPSRTLIAFGGSADDVSAAFGTSFRLFQLANGETRYSLLKEPSVPAAIAPLVKTISGLSQVIHRPSARHSELVQGDGSDRLPQLNASDGSHYLVAGDFATAYDMASTYSAGYTGTGQNIAIAGESRVDAIDISRLQALQGQTAKQPTTYIPPTGVDPGVVGTASGKSSGVQDEATLDVDRTLGNAPGATVDLVVSGDVNGGNTYATSGLFIAINYAISTLNDPILSISFGGCESVNGASNTAYERSIFQTAASQGITTFISSGDDGAASCNAFSSTIPATQVASINDLCAGEFVTCIGGTEFNDSANPSNYWASTNNSTNRTSLLSYIPEGAWNDVSVSNTGVYSYGATGGGTSIYIARPSFQTGNGVPSGSFRLVPDIAFTSSTHDGFVTCLNYLGATCGSFYPFGGTSAAAPSMAAIQAVTNQKLGGRQGNINPKIYALAASSPSVFHDVTVASSGVTNCAASTPSLCNNSTPAQTSPSGLAGYLVNAGYDEVTGWGSLDVANYVSAVSAGTTVASQTVVSLSASTITTAQTVSLTATVSSASTSSNALPTGTVQFQLNGTNVGAAVTVSGGVATLPNQSFSTAGTYSITAIYSGDTTYATSTSAPVSLTVTAAPSFTITPASATLAVISGATTGNTDGLTITSANGFAGTAALTCSVTTTSGTAAGSCSVTPATVTLTSGSSASAILTVNSTVGTSGTLQVVVTGTSGSTVGTAAVTVTVTAPYFRLDAVPATANTVSAAGSTVVSTITATSQSGFSGNVSLSCTTSSTALGTCTISPATVNLAAGGTASAMVTITTVTGASGNLVATVSGSGVTSGSSIAATGSATIAVTVTAPSFSITPATTSLSFTSGATSANTDTITLASSNGFAGAVGLTCTLTSTTAYYPPTCTVAPTSVTLTAGGTGSAVVSIASTTAVTVTQNKTGGLTQVAQGGALFALLFVCYPGRRRVLRTLATLLLIASASATLSGCGEGGNLPKTTTTHSSAGTYTATITGSGTTTGSSVTATASTTFTVTIN